MSIFHPLPTFNTHWRYSLFYAIKLYVPCSGRFSCDVTCAVIEVRYLAIGVTIALQVGRSCLRTGLYSQVVISKSTDAGFFVERHKNEKQSTHLHRLH